MWCINFGDYFEFMSISNICFCDESYLWVKMTKQTDDLLHGLLVNLLSCFTNDRQSIIFGGYKDVQVVTKMPVSLLSMLIYNYIIIN